MVLLGIVEFLIMAIVYGSIKGISVHETALYMTISFVSLIIIWLLACLIYGFGQIVEDVRILREMNEITRHEPFQESSSNLNTNKTSSSGDYEKNGNKQTLQTFDDAGTGLYPRNNKR